MALQYTLANIALREATMRQSRALKQLLSVCVLALAVMQGGCGVGGEYQVYAGQTMGTYYRVTCDCTPGAAALEAELQRVNGQMSNYDAQSQLSMVNRGSVGSWIPVSAELLQVLEYAGALHTETAGAFDITIAPVLALWGFGPEAQALDKRPAMQALHDARARVDGKGLSLRAQPPAVRRDRDVALDLSAIAKGHGVDRLARLLQSLGCAHFLIDIGGEVRSQGHSRQQRPWRVGVEVPDASRMGAVARVVRLHNQAIATSGDYRNFIELDGKPQANEPLRWSHTIDPRTAEPIRHGLASVSVLASTAMEADALATALNVLGPDAGFALAQQQQLAVLFIERTANGYQERYTAGFKDALEPL